MYPCWKKTIDFILSLLGVLLLLPLFLLLSAGVKLDSQGPVFFTQKRVGKNKKHFYIIKFRTMRTDTPKDMPTHLLNDPETYVTKMGKFLRKTSLDELPQLLNIVKGDMSIVGPRPALWNQYDLIAMRDENGANSVYPGLTGWAQVNGRDELPLEVKAGFDGEYVRRMSFLFDCKIIWMTIKKVWTGEGIKR